MAGIQDFVDYPEDFLGHGVLPATQSDSDWLVAVTAGTGVPTHTKGGIGGEATLALDTVDEVENISLHHGDDLNFDIDNILEIEMRVKMGQAALDTATSVAFGLASARNDDIDTIAQQALFRVIGGTDTTAVVVETDDGVNDNDDVATGKTLADAYKKFVISFAKGTNDVRFLIDGDTVATQTTFDMSNYTDGLQPIVQIQKSGGTAGNSIVVDYIRVCSRR